MSDDRITFLIEAIDKASEPLTGIANRISSMASGGLGALGSMSTALAGVGVIAGGAALAGVVALGKAGVDAWGEMDAAADTLMQKTGATGEALTGMTDSVMNLRASAAGLGVDTEVIATTMASLSQRTGATGEVLEGLTGGVLEFSKIMGGDAKSNTESLAGVLAGFNIDAEGSGAALDIAFVAAQKFGVAGNELLGNLEKFGPTLRQMGLGLDESATLLGGLTKAGVDADGVMAAVTKSAGKFAEQGLSIRDGMSQAIAAIQGAATETEAMTIASETFGGRAAVKMVDGIRSGKISLEELTAGLGDTTGALHAATEEALDAPDKWAMGMTQIQNALVPVGEAVMGLASEIMPMVSDVITNVVVPALTTLGGWLKDNLPAAIETLRGVWSAIQPALGTVADFITGTVFPILATLAGWLKDNLPGAIQVLVGFWQGTLWPALQAVAGWLQANLFPILVTLAGWLKDNLPGAIQVLVDIWNNVLSPALSALWAFINDPLAPILKVLAEIIGVTLRLAFEVVAAVWTNILAPALSALWDMIQTYVMPTVVALSEKLGGLQGVLDTVGGWIRDVTDKLSGFRDALANIQLPDFLQRHSPSPIEQTFAGLATVTPQATQTLEAFGAAAGALDTASLNVEAVEALAAAMRTLVRVMGAPGMGVEPGSNDEERINTMSAAIGKIASAISDVVATIREVVAFGGSSDVQFLNGPARDWVMAVFGSLTRLAQDMAVEAGRVQVAFRAGVAQELQAMAAVLGTSLGIMKSVLDIVAVLLSDGRETAERLLNDLAARSWIVALTAGLVYWGNQIADAVGDVVMTFRAEAIPGLENLAALLSPVTDLLGSVIDTVTLLADQGTRQVERLLNDLAARSWIVALTQGLVYWGNQIADAVDDVALTFERDVSDSLQTLGGILSGTTGVLSATIELVQAVIDLGKRGFPTVDATGAVDRVIGPIVALAKALAVKIQQAVGELTVTRQPLSDLTGLLKDTLDLLHAPIDLLTALWSTDYDWAYNIQDPVAWAERNAQGVVAPINAIVALAKALAVKIQQAVGEWKPVETNMAGLSDTMSDMLDLMDKPVALLTALWSTDYDWMYNIQDPVAWAERNAQGVMAPINAIIALAKALAVKIQQAVGEWDGTAPGINELSTILSDFGGLIGSVVDLIEPLANPPTLPALTPALLDWIGDLVEWARAVAEAALDAAKGFKVGVNYGLAELGTAIGDSVGVFEGIVDMAGFIAHPPTLPALTPAFLDWIGNFARWARAVAEAALDAARGFKLGVNYGLAELGTAIGDSVGVFEGIVDIAGFIAHPPMLPALTPRIATWIGDLVGWARAVGVAASEAARGFKLGADYGLAELGTAIGDTLGALRDSLDLGKLLGGEMSLPSPQQVAAKMEAILSLVDGAVTTFSARASAAAAGGLDVAGLSQYAGAVKGVFEAIGEVANAVNSYSNINVGRQFLGVESVGFGNIRGALQMIWDLFEDAASHQDLVQSVTSTLTTALDGLTALATAKGEDAGNAWLAGFQGAVGGGSIALGAGAGAGAGDQAKPQIVNNYVTNNSKVMTANINATTSEAGRGAVMSTFSMVMY